LRIISTPNNRDRIEIIASILEAVSEGESYKSRIMYCASVSDGQLVQYLKFLTEKGLLRRDPKAGTYKITSEGMHFLNVWQQMKGVLRTIKFNSFSLAA
jgi:predicted transcriptional regulator